MKNYMGTVFMMLKNLQKAISEQRDFDGALIVSPENRRYLTGFPASDGYLLVSAERAMLIADSRYIEAAQNEAQGCETVLMTQDRTQVRELFAEMGVTSVAVEASRMTLSEYANFAKAIDPIRLLGEASFDKILADLRSVKTDDEIARIRAAQTIAEQAFDHICGFIAPGKTEREVALELEYYMLAHGAQALSFETIVVSGAKGSMPHGVPDDKVIERGDFVTMDYGAVVGGYHSDMTRTVAVESVNSEQKTVYDTVLRAQNAVLEALRPGLPCSAADKIARDIIADAGYGAYFGHGLGHGVGMEIHEFPNLSPRANGALAVGNVVTDEPGIYLPGRFGVRIEDMVRITPHGCENLTQCPKTLIIL